MQGGPCSVMNTEMTCVLPNFTSLVTGLPTNISYTVRVGAAPGPDLTNEDLILSGKKNPDFAEDGSALTTNEVAIGEGGLITITVSFCLTDTVPFCDYTLLCMQGTDLASVDRSEIRVTVGGEPCPDRGSPGDDVNTVSPLVSSTFMDCVTILFFFSMCVLLRSNLLMETWKLQLW